MQTSKTYIQSVLKRVGLYHRVKASPAYVLYWRFADKSMIERRREELNFYRKLLCGFRKGSLIFDVGANQGVKTDIFLRLGANVVAVEPDPTNQMILKQKYLKYRLVQRPVIIVGKAVSDKNAIETLWIDEAGSTMNTLSLKWVEALRSDEERFGRTLDFAGRIEVETVTLEQLMNEYGLLFSSRLMSRALSCASCEACDDPFLTFPSRSTFLSFSRKDCSVSNFWVQ